jgi:hypothetical protein
MMRDGGPRSGVRLASLARLLAASAFVGFGALGVTACEDAPIGPSLGAVQVTNLGLRPSQANNDGVCCCVVTGQARNDNSVAVHVTIKFSAFNVAPQPNAPPPDPLSTILYFIRDLQPGQTHRIDAHGFIFPCSTLPSGIANVQREVEVKGITYPPF